MKSILIGSRPSLLALKQVEEIKQHFPQTDFKIVTIKTSGDKDKFTPLAELEREDFFTREIEQALLEGKIDAAIHSAKDLEKIPPANTTIAAMTHSISIFECLISRGNLTLGHLSAGAVVGTSSLKRKTSLIDFREDLIVKDIRGNVDERIKQLDQGKFDAIIVAHAALIRLGYESRIAEIIPENIIEPHPLQGRLSVQVLANRPEMINLFRSINEQ